MDDKCVSALATGAGLRANLKVIDKGGSHV